MDGWLHKLVLALSVAAWASCNLMLDRMAGGKEAPDSGQVDTSSDPDAGADPCPGYEGFDVDCCTLDDPCGWADDDYCDCDGTCSWDAADCDQEADTAAALHRGWQSNRVFAVSIEA